jgi:hypothetical protein
MCALIDPSCLVGDVYGSGSDRSYVPSDIMHACRRLYSCACHLVQHVLDRRFKNKQFIIDWLIGRGGGG